MRLLSWLVRAFIFFMLFAFALNNQQAATVHGFFGVQWSSPLVVIVLAAFSAGCAVGVLAMLPGLWQHWRRHQQPLPVTPPAPPVSVTTSILPSEFGVDQTPRLSP
jgi:putative membrane protein